MESLMSRISTASCSAAIFIGYRVSVSLETRFQVGHHLAVLLTHKPAHTSDPTDLDVVEAVLGAVGLRAEHGEEVTHGLHFAHGLGVHQPGLDALWCVRWVVYDDIHTK